MTAAEPATDDLNDGVQDLDEGAEIIEVATPLESYGADFPVDGLVKRLDGGDILIPTFDPEYEDATGIKGFQRQYIWKKRQADRFVESLLLGFPVPGIFLVREPDNRYLVLDGAQRLRTLQSFYVGLLRGSEFNLEEVQKAFRGKTYKTLDPSDRRRLDNSIIHATVINRTVNNGKSVYLVFERLNTGGTLLSPQEVRVALYHGTFVDFLRKANGYSAWRSLFGKKSPHLKDQELILRIFAMLDNRDKYSQPMKEFLSDYLAQHQDISARTCEERQALFSAAATAVMAGIGPKAFRLERALNAALAESIMVGVMSRLRRGPILDPKSLEPVYKTLISREDFRESVTRATANEEHVATRLTLSIGVLGQVK
jgi:hypothetical protein